ncbi:MAG TPA: HAD hydrolase-like protein [Mobilitalea sp.]|nr:HAD hydrolase-like protein [Mobilitalea sp.]
MANIYLDNFKKSHDYLVCIDSDGTAMDVMNVKHIKCFGPCFVSEWKLEEHREDVLKLWNKINLFTATRGKNRFITLLDILTRYNGTYLQLEDLGVFRRWVENTRELSNQSLMEEIQRFDSITLRNVLNWSIETNKAIAALTFEDKKPFEGVRECLACAQDKADIAVISSAGFDVIHEEWEQFDLLQYIEVMVGQEIGSKKHSIEMMLMKGYDRNKVIKLGDALTDYDAAKENGILFYPILPGKEVESWEHFRNYYLDELTAGNYPKYQAELVNQFENILK